ncbi:MAG: helix-turn-helix transcriptional regulator [Candidatus Dormibacter sp.]
MPQGWKRPYLEAAGARLQELREAAGLSRPELAIRAGITRGYLRKLEAGDHAPKAEMAAKLAAALGVEVAAFSPRAAGVGVESRPPMTTPT